MPADESRTDDELIRAVNAGDASAFDALYYRHRDWVVRLAYRFTLNHDDALDVLQETFWYLARKFPSLQLSSKLTTFLYPVVKNTSLTIRRKRRPGELLPEVPAAPARADDPRADLASVLSGLSAEQREIVLMRFVDDMHLDEIAGALALPVGTVKSRLHYALGALRADPRTRHYFHTK